MFTKINVITVQFVFLFVVVQLQLATKSMIATRSLPTPHKWEREREKLVG